MHTTARWFLVQEARSLLKRLDRIRPYALAMPMVTAATVSPMAQNAIEQHMIRGRRILRTMVHRFLQWVESGPGQTAPPEVGQRKFTFLRLRFNAVVTQFEIFKDVLAQRSEHDTGVWVSGLDDVARDALTLPGNFYRTPPVICYVDRGHGAAIRRARTRLPGGESNPVAIIRIPRERMIGSGIASSLVHEVGHQGAALLGLVESVGVVLKNVQKGAGGLLIAWTLWDRWISEILADFWSVAKIGIASTMGLIGVVSLPRPFVFRFDPEDPHPIPWIRVKLSCAMGQALFPHPQWQQLASLWEAFYPIEELDEASRSVLRQLEHTMPAFVGLLAHHRPASLRGQSLSEVFNVTARQPHHLRMAYQEWRISPNTMWATAPTLAFAVIGQAKSDGQISPEDESQILAKLLTHWALQSSLYESASCANLKIANITQSSTNHMMTALV